MLQLRQRVIASYHLGPMDRAETEEYIKHRLAHVGWQGDPSFDAAAFDVIHQFTGGIPRKINTLCNRLLLAGYLGETHSVSARDVEAVTAEIKEELGDEHASLYRLRAAAALIQGGEESEFEDASTTTGITSRPATGDHHLDRSGVHDVSPESLEGRVVSLEKAMLATLGVLQRLVEKNSDERASEQTGA
jgi:hypothetical protein